MRKKEKEREKKTLIIVYFIFVEADFYNIPFISIYKFSLLFSSYIFRSYCLLHFERKSNKNNKY